MTGATYVAGLWTQNLLKDLSWRRATADFVESNTDFIAPTFSPASVSCPIQFLCNASTYATTEHMGILGITYETSDGNPYSMAKAGELVVQGPVLYVYLRSEAPKVSRSYKLYIGERTISAHSHGESWAEMTSQFVIDTPLRTTVGDGEKGMPQASLSRATSPAHNSQYVEGRVALLGLYSTHGPDFLIQHYLILAKISERAASFERIGSGIGILKSNEKDVPVDVETMMPFDWVHGDEEGSQRSENLDTSLETIRIV